MSKCGLFKDSKDIHTIHGGVQFEHTTSQVQLYEALASNIVYSLVQYANVIPPTQPARKLKAMKTPIQTTVEKENLDNIVHADS